MKLFNMKLYLLGCSLIISYFLIFVGLPLYTKGPEVRFYRCNDYETHSDDQSLASSVYKTY